MLNGVQAANRVPLLRTRQRISALFGSGISVFGRMM